MSSIEIPAKLENVCNYCRESVTCRQLVHVNEVERASRVSALIQWGTQNGLLKTLLKAEP
jgi:hypothetical protein